MDSNWQNAFKIVLDNQNNRYVVGPGYVFAVTGDTTDEILQHLEDLRNGVEMEEFFLSDEVDKELRLG